QSEDSQGAIDSHDVTITITGSNDKPIITFEAGDSDSASLTETDASLITSGTLTVTDLTVTDTVTVSVTNVIESGNVSGITHSTLLAMLSVPVGNILDNTEIQDQFTWNFNSGAEAFNYLAAGETLTLTYTVRATDSQAATDDQSVVINITGTNDAPDITVESGDSASDTLVETDTTLSTSGTLTVTDFDVTDEVIVNASELDVIGNVGGLLNSDLLNMLTFSNPVIDSNNNEAQFIWTFDSNNEAFDYLNPFEVLTLDYTIRVEDSQGVSDNHMVRIVINGSNDESIIKILFNQTVLGINPLGYTEISEASSYVEDLFSFTFDNTFNAIDTNHKEFIKTLFLDSNGLQNFHNIEKNHESISMNIDTSLSDLGYNLYVINNASKGFEFFNITHHVDVSIEIVSDRADIEKLIIIDRNPDTQKISAFLNHNLDELDEEYKFHFKIYIDRQPYDIIYFTIKNGEIEQQDNESQNENSQEKSIEETKGFLEAAKEKLWSDNSQYTEVKADLNYRYEIEKIKNYLLKLFG
ncbi:VCBS domain-containing protein, partial [Thiotrichales bacterium 19X7-9]|nr:VCBS domain-containing protein [Thiotrichales bacterium 19X7-9]